MKTILLKWCLKQFKDYILKFSLIECFFSGKELLNLYTMICFNFPLGGCIDEVFYSQTNYQEYKYVYFFKPKTLTVIHSMKQFVRLSRKPFSMHAVV